MPCGPCWVRLSPLGPPLAMSSARICRRPRLASASWFCEPNHGGAGYWLGWCVGEVCGRGAWEGCVEQGRVAGEVHPQGSACRWLRSTLAPGFCSSNSGFRCRNPNGRGTWHAGFSSLQVINRAPAHSLTPRTVAYGTPAACNGAVMFGHNASNHPSLGRGGGRELKAGWGRALQGEIKVAATV